MERETPTPSQRARATSRRLRILPRRASALNNTQGPPVSRREWPRWITIKSRSAKMQRDAGEICEVCYETPLDPDHYHTKRGEKGKTKAMDGGRETWSMLACGHRFGHRCLRTWLSEADVRQNITAACPKCRAPFRHSCGHPMEPVALAKPEDMSQVKEGLELWSRRMCPYCFDHREKLDASVLAVESIKENLPSIDPSKRMTPEEYQARLLALEEQFHQDWKGAWMKQLDDAPKKWKDKSLPNKPTGRRHVWSIFARSPTT